jgi:dCMP deaminase
MQEIDKWDLRFLELARHVSSWSKDPSTKCGAIISDRRHRIVGEGYNGFPQGVNDLPERYADRALKYDLTIHAEENAILFATKAIEGCTIYVHPMCPCVKCAAKLIQVGIRRVVTKKLSPDLIERWGESVKLSKIIFREVGIELVEI